jgi:hypothetical protein
MLRRRLANRGCAGSFADRFVFNGQIYVGRYQIVV